MQNVSKLIMKLFDNIFSSIYLFYKGLNDGRHGAEMPIIGAIFVLTLLLSANVLSFFPTKEINRIPWLYYPAFIMVCSVLITHFYRKKRYLKVVSKFENEKNKGIYHFVAIAYIVLSLAVFVMSR